jgi:N-methylhydantoinase B
MTGVDPVELELTRNLLEAAAEEMGHTLQRVAFSANIKERRDFSCALFNPAGELLAQAAHIPVHLGSMPASVAAVLDRLGPLEDGEVAIVNDPFAGGTHLPDVTLVSPIDYEGRRVGYAANRAHHADVGGISPGSMTLSRHIDEEGVRIEPTLLYRRGARDEAVLARFLNAVRTPQERLGDLDAQLAANRVGATALRRIVRRNGVDHTLQYGTALLNYAHAFVTRAIHGMPRGDWTFEDTLDDDGAGSGPVAIRATVHLRGDQVEVDLSDSAAQVPGCVNCPRAVTLSAVYYCFLCLLDESVPHNGGSFRGIRVITQPGTVVDAVYPAAVVAGNTETSQRIVDVVFGALAQAMPGRIPAASCGTMSSVALGGEGWTYYETIGGGGGAGPSWPGATAVQCHMTNTLNTPAEAVELQYPLRVRRYALIPDSGGTGRFTGGAGIVRELEALAACEGTLIADRHRGRPYGLHGGAAGAPGTVAMNGSPLDGGKNKLALSPGDVLRICTPGGGGWG